MKIRPATVADAPAMGQVIVETFLASNQGILSEQALQRRTQEWTPEVSARNWARTISDMAAGNEPYSCIYVAEDEAGRVVGLAMGSPAGAETGSAGGGQVGEVNVLYVSLQHQRRGIGRALVQATAAQLARWGMTKLQIATQVANDEGRRFYERIGGRVAGTRVADEEGEVVLLVVFEWADIQKIVQKEEGASS